MMTLTPVGVDIAKAKFDVAALHKGKYKTKTFHNTSEGFALFSAWLMTFDTCHICMEATGTYGDALATFLADHGILVSVVNPAQIAAFAKTELARSKTDKGDAKLIARFCGMHQPPAWQPLPRSVRQLQALVRRLDNLIEMQQMERNRLDTADPRVVPSIQCVIDTLTQQVDTTRRHIRQHIDDDPDLRQRHDLLDSIPGIGPGTIPYLLAAIGDPLRFRGAKQLAAFAGVTPAERQSGKWKGQTRLSKTGDALLRKALYLPSLVAWQHNPIIRAFCERLKAKGKNGKAIVCAAMRKLLHIAYGVLKSGQPFDPNKTLA